jgi:opacity protein-like surface antigen
MILLTLVCSVRFADAQPPGSAAEPSRIDLRVSYGLASSIGSGSLSTDYIPSLEYGQSTGSASQTLTLSGDDATMLAIGLDYWPARSFGMQLLAEWADAEVRGTSSAYDVHLDYEARQPPDYELRPYQWDRTYDWDDPTGEIETLTIAFNAIGRWPLGGRFTGTLAAGVASTRVEGEIDSLGFTTFRLGGHAVLFPEEFRIGTALDSTWITGWNLGATLELQLSRRFAVVLGYRHLGGSEEEVPVRVREILNAEEVVNPIPIEEIEERLSPGSARIDVGGSRTWAGIRFALY